MSAVSPWGDSAWGERTPHRQYPSGHLTFPAPTTPEQELFSAAVRSAVFNDGNYRAFERCGEGVIEDRHEKLTSSVDSHVISAGMNEKALKSMLSRAAPRVRECEQGSISCQDTGPL